VLRKAQEEVEVKEVRCPDCDEEGIAQVDRFIPAYAMMGNISQISVEVTCPPCNQPILYLKFLPEQWVEICKKINRPDLVPAQLKKFFMG
jgi:hypothetical protein